jgi:hypothetical protein
MEAESLSYLRTLPIALEIDMILLIDSEGAKS